MILISYDITSDKTRTKFSKFLKEYGNKVQYSVYELKNSKRILNIVTSEIEHRFKKYFKNTDSVYIFRACNGCETKVLKYGSASHEDKDVVYLE